MVKNGVGMERVFKPGEICLHSGQYVIVDSEGKAIGSERTVVRDKPFPPTPQQGQGYLLVDQTQHRGITDARSVTTDTVSTSTPEAVSTGDEKGFWGGIAAVLALVAAIIALPTSVSKGIEALQNPGVGVISAGIVLLAAMISASYMLSKKDSVSTLQRVLAAIVVAVGTIVILLSIGFWVGSNWQRQLSVSELPLSVLHSYTFEGAQDPIEIAPWRSAPAIKSHTLLVYDDKEFSHSGTQSLRLNCEFQPIKTDSSEWAGISAFDLEFSNVKVIVAWVLVPRSEQTRDGKLRSRITAWTLDPAGEPVGLYSESKVLEPGVWTPIFLGTFDTLSNANFEWNREIFQIALEVWSDKPYSGSVYFDDIVIYADATVVK